MTQQVKQAILNAYQDENLFKQCQPVIEKIEQMRQQLDYEKYTIQFPGNPTDIENSQHEYLRYLNLIIKYLRFDPNDQKCPQVSFSWSDSLNQKKFTVSSSGKYEQVCQYLNHAITCYYVANEKLNKDNDAERKQAISKLRNALYFLDLIKTLINQIPHQILQENSDLQMHYIQFLENYFIALCYKILYQTMVSQLKTFGVPNVVAPLFQASQYLLYANNYLQQFSNVQKQLDKQLLNQWIIQIKFNSSWCTLQACTLIAKFHYQRIQDEPRAKHMGMALGFLERGKQTISQFDINQLKNTFPHLITNFSKAEAEFQEIYKEYIYKNQQIYKEVAVPDNQLPVPPLLQQLFIKPLIRVGFADPLPDEQKFGGFSSEEAVILAKEVRLHIQSIKQQLEESLSLLENQSTQLYTSLKVNYLIDLYHQQGQQNGLPQSVQEKINFIRVSRGWKGVEDLLSSQQDLQAACQFLISNIDQDLLNEQAIDGQLREQYGNRWDRTPSHILNELYFRQLNEFKTKFQQTQQLDQDSRIKLQQLKEAILLTEYADNIIQQKLPQCQNQTQIVQNHKQQLTQLIQLHDKFQQLLKELRQVVKQLDNEIKQSNYTKMAENARQQGIPNQQLFQEVVGQHSGQIEKFNQNMNQASQLCNQINSIVIQINSANNQLFQQNNTLQQDFETIYLSITNINYAIAFYSQFIENIDNLKIKVKDFVLARDLEKIEKIQQFGAQGTQQGIYIYPK